MASSLDVAAGQVQRLADIESGVGPWMIVTLLLLLASHVAGDADV